MKDKNALLRVCTVVIVAWQPSSYNVTEGSGSVEICAEISHSPEAVETVGDLRVVVNANPVFPSDPLEFTPAIGKCNDYHVSTMFITGRS